MVGEKTTLRSLYGCTGLSTQYIGFKLDDSEDVLVSEDEEVVTWDDGRITMTAQRYKSVEHAIVMTLHRRERSDE